MTVSNFASSSPSSGTLQDLAWPSPTTAGSTLVAICRSGSSATVTCNLVSGASLTALQIDNGAGRQTVFYLQNGPGGSQTAHFIFNSSSAPRLMVLEIPNAIAASFDAANSNTGASGTALDGGAVTTVAANEEIIFAGSAAGNETFAQHGSYSIVGVEPAAGSSRLVAAHQSVSSTGSYTGAADDNSSQAWIGQTVAFKTSGGPATASPPPFSKPLRIWKRRIVA